MWGKTQVSFGTFGIYEQTNITVFAMTVAGSSAIPWQPPEAALYLGVIELCTSRLLFQSHDTLPPIILVAEPLGPNELLIVQCFISDCPDGRMDKDKMKEMFHAILPKVS